MSKELDEKVAEIKRLFKKAEKGNWVRAEFAFYAREITEVLLEAYDIEREKRRWAECRIEVLERTFRHTHVNWRGRDTDMCEKCHLDLRDDIHLRWLNRD